MHFVVVKSKHEGGVERGQEMQNFLDGACQQYKVHSMYLWSNWFSPTHYNLKVAFKTYSPKMFVKKSV